MCGIAGFIGLSETGDSLGEWLRMAVKRQSHRGPDSDGYWFSPDGQVGLGHTRLSILGLGPQGNQPFASESREVQLVFNGEIYNHRLLRQELQQLGFVFRSSTDTEVILRGYQAWGKGVLGRLDGMFAMAIVDLSSSTILLARDRVGQKPLHMRWSSTGLLFSSELRPLIQPGDSINGDALHEVMSFGFTTDTSTLVKQVERLRPGSWLCIDIDSLDCRQGTFWTPPPLDESSSAPMTELISELKSVLGSAVRSQLDADVPVGVLLSSGVDSTLIAAIASQATHIRTYTVAFPGSGATNEARVAAQTAKQLGATHTEIHGSDWTSGGLRVLLEDLDEPLADSSVVPTALVYREITKSVRVALGGDGGDELFGGYGHYLRYRTHHWVQNLSPAIRWRLVDSGSRTLGRFGLRTGALEDLRFSMGMTRPRDRSLFPEGVKKQITGLATSDGVAPHEVASAETLQMIDLATYLPNDLMLKVDRTSMRQSLEARSPLLANQVLDFALTRVPIEYKVSSQQTKILARRLLEDLDLGDVSALPKRGFSMPTGHWIALAGGWDAVVETITDTIGDRLGAHSPRKMMSAETIEQQSERNFFLYWLSLWKAETGVGWPT